MNHPSNPINIAGDMVAIAAITGVWLQIIPAVAAFFAIIWYGILIWESDTVRGLTGRVKMVRRKDEHSDFL